jgi:hypothetical protein
MLAAEQLFRRAAQEVPLLMGSVYGRNPEAWKLAIFGGEASKAASMMQRIDRSPTDGTHDEARSQRSNQDIEKAPNRRIAFRACCEPAGKSWREVARSPELRSQESEGDCEAEVSVQVVRLSGRGL